MTSATGAERSIIVSGLPTWYAQAADKAWIIPRTAKVPAGPTTEMLRETTAREIDIITWTNNQIANNYPADNHLIGVWCGAAMAPDYYLSCAEGGHQRTSDNGVYVFGPFSGEDPKWTRVHNADDSQTNPSDDPYYPATGRPASRHGYHNVTYVPDLGGGVGNTWFSYQCGAPYPGGGDQAPAVTKYEFASPMNTPAPSDTAGVGSGVWSTEGQLQAFPPGTKAGLLEQGCIDWDSGDELAYIYSSPFTLYSWDPQTETFTSHAMNPARTNSVHAKCGAIDPVRRIAVGKPEGAHGDIVITDISSAHRGDWFRIAAIGDPTHPNQTTAGSNGPRPGMAFEPVGGKFVVWDGGQILWTLEPPDGFRNGTNDPAEPITDTTPANWVWEQVTGISGASPPDTGDNNGGLTTTGVYGKFRYVESIKALCTQSFGENDMHVFKVPEAGL